MYRPFKRSKTEKAGLPEIIKGVEARGNRNMERIALKKNSVKSKKELIETGLKEIKEVPEGTHFCLFYQTKKDLLKMLVPYFRAGLRNNEFCILIGEEPLQETEIKRAMAKAMPDFNRYLKKGQIKIISSKKWYFENGKFDEKKALKGLIDKLNKAQKAGYEGLRLADNAFLLKKNSWKKSSDYERAFNDFIENYNILAMCAHSLEKYTAPEIVNITANHQFNLIKKNGRWSALENSASLKSNYGERKNETEQMLERHKQRLELLSLSSEKLLTAENPEIAIDEICKKVASFLDCQAFLNYVFDPDINRFHLVNSCCFPDRVLKKIEWLDYEDTAHCGCFPEKPKKGKERNIASILLNYGIQAHYCLPLNYQNKLVGRLLFGTKTHQSFSDEEINLMKSIANQVAVAIQRKQSESERERLIQELLKGKKKTDELLTYIESEKNSFSTIMENTKTNLAFLDRDFKFIAVNSSYCRGSGFAEKELIGKQYFALFPNEEAQNIFKKVRDTGKPIEFFSHPSFFKDRPWLGITYWDWTLAPVKNENGAVTGLVLSLLDVTDRIRNEKELEKHSMELEELTTELKKVNLAVENASDMIFITDPDGKILFANKATANILGYAPETVIGKRPSFWGNRMSKDFYENLWRTIKVNKSRFSGEINNVRNNGEEFTAEVNIAPILNDTNELLYFVCIERDVTEHAKIDRTKTEFISLAAHQLRTPLTSISLTAELLLREISGEINKEGKRYLLDIFNNVKKMTELIEIFLNISRIELGKFEVVPEPTHPVNVLEDNLDEVMPGIELKKIKLERDFNNNLPFVKLDKRTIHIILENVLSNAVKYTPSNGIIKASIRKTVSDLVFEISDTGCGIPKGEQDQVFKRLYRASNVREKNAEGTGLGLYLARELAENAGGKIWLESQENKGTTVYISFPLTGMMEKKISNAS